MNKPSKLSPPFFIINNPNAPRLCPELAQEIGLTESILLLQIEFWIRLTPKEHDGKMWMYDSIGDWKAQFPFLSASTINRAIKSLVKQELVFIGNYNKAKYDRTRWFALNPKGINRCKSVRWDAPDYENFDESETRSNQNGTRQNQNGTTIPDLSADLSAKDSATAEKIPSSKTPAELKVESDRQYDEMQSMSADLPPAKLTGAGVSDPTIDETEKTMRYADVFSDILDSAPIKEHYSAARKMVNAKWYRENAQTVDNLLNKYRNGSGAQFRKDGQNAYFILTQLQRDLARKQTTNECAGAEIA